MKKLWIMVVALVLVLGAAGYTIAQSTGGPQGGQMGMMGPGMGMMGGGQGGMMMGSGGQGGMMGSGMMNMMMGQPLTPEQQQQLAEQIAKQHGISVDQAKQMTEQCTQMMGSTTTPPTEQKQ